MANLFFREEAIRQFQEERRKRREKEDLQRERFRDEIRQKYGIARKAESFGSIEKNLQVPVCVQWIKQETLTENRLTYG